MPRTAPAMVAVGAGAIVFSALYFLSDVIEVVQGGFSVAQLWLTLVAEAAIPVFVVGISIMCRGRLGHLGLISAVAYAYCYVVLGLPSLWLTPMVDNFQAASAAM
jgi:hypothetical protein|nr:hypothetical protein [Aeromicrobium sp.]